MLSTRIKKRIDKIVIGGTVIFALIIGKLAYVQILDRETLFSKAQDLWERDFPVSGLRGNVLDINGEVLATDIPSTSVMVVPAQITDPDSTAQQLADILETEKENIYKQITRKVSTQRIVPYGRLISNEQAKAIDHLDLTGVYLVQDSLRYYPNGAYLAQVLGFTGVDNQGLAGLELQYEEILKANKGSMKIPFDAKGHPVKIYSERYEAPGQGMDVMLTIDTRIQSILERELNNAMERYNPDSAWGLAMNPNTGEILAMVSKPDFDPNHYQDYDESVYNRNLPVWMSYEPGSTFKTVTFSAGLEEGLFDMEHDGYYDRGYEIVEGARLKSWKAGGHGQQTYMQCLQNSSNPCFVHIAQMLGGDNLSKYLDAFGFGQKTGVDLPARPRASCSIPTTGGCWNSRRRVSARAFPSRRFSWSRLSARLSTAGRCTSRISPRRSCIRRPRIRSSRSSPTPCARSSARTPASRCATRWKVSWRWAERRARISTAIRSAARPERPRRRRTARI